MGRGVGRGVGGGYISINIDRGSLSNRYATMGTLHNVRYKTLTLYTIAMYTLTSYQLLGDLTIILLTWYE